MCSCLRSVVIFFEKENSIALVPIISAAQLSEFCIVKNIPNRQQIENCKKCQFTPPYWIVAWEAKISKNKKIFG